MCNITHYNEIYLHDNMQKKPTSPKNKCNIVNHYRRLQVVIETKPLTVLLRYIKRKKMHHDSALWP